MLAVVTAILVVGLGSKIRGLRRADSMAEPEAWCALGFGPSSSVVLKAARLQRRTSSWRPRWASWGNMVLAALMCVEVSLVHRTLLVGAGDDGLFDPHAVLGIETSANVTEIKAAYRKLALEYHPDKNPDPQAAPIFTAIAKAHKILTDPIAAENYAKYGNADGYQGFVGGFGLPAWMMNESALLPALALVIGLPLLALLFTRDPDAKRARAIQLTASQVYYTALFTPPPSARSAPASMTSLNPAAVAHPKLLRLVAASYATLAFEGGLSTAQRIDLLRLKAALKPGEQTGGKGGGEKKGGGGKKSSSGSSKKGGKKGSKGKGKKGGGGVAEAEEEVEADESAEVDEPLPVADDDTDLADLDSAAALPAVDEAAAAAVGVVEAREWLLEAYLLRAPVPASLQPELSCLLRHAPAVCEAFFAIALRAKRLPFTDGALPVLHLAQCLCQAVPHNAASGDRSSATSGLLTLLQLPHITPPALAKLSNLTTSGEQGGVPSTRRIGDVIALKPAQLNALLGAIGTLGVEASASQQRREVQLFCASIFPRAVLEASHTVKGEEDGSSVALGDILTVCATLRLRHRCPPGSRTAPSLPALSCHAPLYPHPKTEGWVLVLTSKGGGRVHNVCAAPPAWEKWTADEANGGGWWTGELKTRVEKAGKLELEVHAVCSAYVGADLVTKVEVDVVHRRAVLDDDDDDDDDEDGDEGEESEEFDNDVDDSDCCDSD